MKSKKANLDAAKRRKNDEFYTRYKDIENEVGNYREFFIGKTVLCNCDDPWCSQFFHFFQRQFNFFGLKRLIGICHAKTPTLVARGYDGIHGCVAYVDSVRDIDIQQLNGDGDFRSEECKRILKKADIVVTNPPFSLWREYITQLLEYDKKFLILGPLNGIGYKESFPAIKDGKMWLGYNNPAPKNFIVLDTKTTTKNIEIVNGTPCAKFGNIIWFTNLDVDKRHTPLLLEKDYNESNYSFFDNYAAINIDRVKDIPKDYNGVMGVPITFLDKHCLEQFEIIDIAKPGESSLKTKVYSKEEYPEDYSKLNRGATMREDRKLVCKYHRVFIKKR